MVAEAKIKVSVRAPPLFCLVGVISYGRSSQHYIEDVKTVWRK